MSSWIKLHRSLLDWGWYSDPVCGRLFIHLLLLANHKPKVWMGSPILEGQTPVGRKELADSLGFSEQQIRTALERLKSTNEITIKPSNKYSLITIVNWSKYQVSNQQDNQQLTNEQPTTNQQLTTPKEGKKERKERSPLPPSGDFERLWNTWSPYDMDKGSKFKARQSYEKSIKNCDAEMIINQATLYCKQCLASQTKTKHLSTWLNQQGYNDIYEAAKRKPLSSL